MTTLTPIQHKDAYTRVVESVILGWMREAVFMPLLIDLFNADVPVDPQYQQIKFDEEGRINAMGAVRAALESGRIHYADGLFTGRFSSQISGELRAMGATRDLQNAGFRLAQSQLPDDIKAAVVSSMQKARELHTQISNTLAAMETNIASSALGLNFKVAVDRILTDAGRQFISSVASNGSVAVVPDFTDATRAQLTEALTTNTELGIRGWAAERIPQLRRRVEENVFKGMRTDKLARIIEAEFGVGKRKAEFLADQETGLLMAKYRQGRYQDVGVQEYIWQTSNDIRVRPDHAALNGRRFNFNAPPITDKATGRRNNPGEDYRCRCVPKPILNFVPTP